jgi:hypothetical protein
MPVRSDLHGQDAVLWMMQGYIAFRYVKYNSVHEKKQRYDSTFYQIKVRGEPYAVSSGFHRVHDIKRYENI